MEDGYEGIYSLCMGLWVEPEPASIELLGCRVFMSSALDVVLYLGLFFPFTRDANLRSIGSERG
jgi:hypothetical protein